MQRNLVLLSLLLLASPTFGSEDGGGKADEPRFHWNDEIKKVRADTTRLRIRSGGDNRKPDEEKTLFETQDPATIDAFVKMLAVREDKIQPPCNCNGNPSFEFYKGNKLIITVGFHHGRAIRWPEYFRSDGMLEEEAAAALIKWLKEHGIKVQ